MPNIIDIILAILIVILISFDIYALQDYLYCLSKRIALSRAKIKYQNILEIVNVILIPIMAIVSIYHNSIR